MTSFRLEMPRASVELSGEAHCFADPVLFLPWDEMPAEAQEEFRIASSIPCEGGGVPGSWCANCRFGTVNEYEGEPIL